MNVNRVTLIGFTGKDAKTGATQAGKTMTRLSLATAKRWKDAAGEWQEKTQWHDCVAYGSAGDYATKILKGQHIMIEGELVHREDERPSRSMAISRSATQWSCCPLLKRERLIPKGRVF